MTPKLSEDQRQALRERPDGPVPVEDEQTHKLYVLVEQQNYEQAMQALRQQQADIAAVQAGLDAAREGRIAPLHEVDARIRQNLGFPAFP